MSDSMVERVARAICAKAGYDKPWDAFNPSEQGMFTECARAAIEAMRPLGEELVATTSWNDEINFCGPLDAYGFTHLWEAAIDAALKE